MAKRKRLVPAFIGSDMAQIGAQTGGQAEARAPLRPGLGSGLSSPPIAQVAGDAAAQSALAELSDAMARARTEGRLVQALPLAEVEVDHLVRDRIETDEEELGHLIASIREHGQRSPVEVTELAPGRYGLISGWRRIKALSRLYAENQDPRFAHVQALLRRPDSASDAYIAMVEENEVRLGLSYYERARIAARSVDLGVFETEKQALQRLFSAASRARRSKIGSFLSLYRRLDDVLRFPAAIPERLGLALAKAVEEAPARLTDLVADLADTPADTAAEEMARLSAFAENRVESAVTEPVSAPKAEPRAEPKPKPEPKAEPAAGSGRQELRPGVFLDVTGGWSRPVLTLSGPNVGPDFRDRLEKWLAGAG